MSNQSDDEFETGDAGGPSGGGGPGEMSAPGGVGGPRGLGAPAGLDGGQIPPGKVRQIWSTLAVVCQFRKNIWLVTIFY